MYGTLHDSTHLLILEFFFGGRGLDKSKRSFVFLLPIILRQKGGKAMRFCTGKVFWDYFRIMHHKIIRLTGSSVPIWIVLCHFIVFCGIQMIPVNSGHLLTSTFLPKYTLYKYTL
ncbi:Dynamin-binding protein [Platysternon megacephalum]|uniref:Dynamin-binding protein n=1 Tax=Platysternon megacephalum TaxID=55544 RepID=A0A4D9E6C1_9SAUR|nr:Dynamin-binding protein [Platysternon megacephalum]